MHVTQQGPPIFSKLNLDLQILGFKRKTLKVIILLYFVSKESHLTEQATKIFTGNSP